MANLSARIQALETASEGIDPDVLGLCLRHMWEATYSPISPESDEWRPWAESAVSSFVSSEAVRRHVLHIIEHGESEESETVYEV